MAKLRSKALKKRSKIIKHEELYISNNIVTNKCTKEEFLLKQYSILIDKKARKIK